VIRGALFDLDGTLIDSEQHTDAVIASVLARCGHRGAALSPAETRGRTWGDIVTTMIDRYALTATPAAIEADLVAAWSSALDQMLPIAGAAAAVRALAAWCPVGVVSSSPRALVDRLLAQLGVLDVVSVRVGADDVQRPKPDPEGFLRAASLLGVPADQCVVFEDSSAGLTAARAAGMATVLVLARCAEPERCRALATVAIADYDSVVPDAWTRLAAAGLRALEVGP